MQLVNTTRLAAAYTLGMEPSGREHLVVVVKGTFDIPDRPDVAPPLSAEQVPVVLADVLGGESGALPVEDADLSLRKTKCDVLVKGSAHAPAGRPTARVQVGVRVGHWSKTFQVVGDRYWGPAGATQPEPFRVMPITYERAFGGVLADPDDPGKSVVYRPNPVGRGFHPRGTSAGAPLPNTERLDEPVERPGADYVPMSLGPVGRSWFPRYTFAGTYDQRWLEDTCPFLPADFDDRYNQAAPADQQLPYPTGGEEIVLLNLTPQGRTAFCLPRASASVIVTPRHAGREALNAVIDTIGIEPDLGRFTMCWRCSRPLRRSLFEIVEVIVGRVGHKFLRERDGLPLPHPAWAQRSSEESPPVNGRSR